MREALLNNLKNINLEDLKKTIDEGISSQEETILVGLGVLFELYYCSLNSTKKQNFLEELHHLL